MTRRRNGSASYLLRWLLPLASSVAIGCGSSTGIDPADRAALFDEYWGAFDRIYPAFPVKQVDWNAQRAAFRDEAIATRSTAELVDVLSEMTAVLHDVHTGFYRPNGAFVLTWTPTAEINWDRDQWQRALPSYGYTQVKPTLGYGTLAGGIGYVVLATWSSGAFTVVDADAVLDRFASAPGLVIDMRMNSGGNDAIAFAVAGRFLTTTRTAGTVQYRNGADHAALTAPQPLSVSPRGRRLTMPVVLLTGRAEYSTTEEFVDAMRQEPLVTTFGDTTGGGSGNPEQRDLAEGWSYRLPRWLHFASDGKLIEGHGIAPEHYQPWDAAAASAGHDVVLEAAVDFLRGSVAASRAGRTTAGLRR